MARETSAGCDVNVTILRCEKCAQARVDGLTLNARIASQRAELARLNARYLELKKENDDLIGIVASVRRGYA